MKALFRNFMILRTAQKGDRNQIVALINQVTGERRFLQTLCYEPTAAWEKLLGVGHDCGAGMCLIVLAAGKNIIGIGRLFADRHDTPERRTGNVGLVLAPAWRGKGWGTILLRQLISCARQMGYEYVRAEILQCNARSLKLFQKFKFTVTNHHKLYWLATQDLIDEVTVERCIKRPAGSCRSINSDGANGTFSNNEEVYQSPS
jgi:RimJ/RimL family protein N-acetyltransferase